MRGGAEAGVVGALIASFVLFIVQLAIEGERLRSEALANKARRLRYRDNDMRVEVPPLKPNCYHIFLSHVHLNPWASEPTSI